MFHSSGGSSDVLKRFPFLYPDERLPPVPLKHLPLPHYLLRHSHPLPPRLKRRSLTRKVVSKGSLRAPHPKRQCRPRLNQDGDTRSLHLYRRGLWHSRVHVEESDQAVRRRG